VWEGLDFVLCGLEKGLFIGVWEGMSFGADGSVLQFSGSGECVGGVIQRSGDKIN
jgi:hypothetical protein